jgi:hypothetical protein
MILTVTALKGFLLKHLLLIHKGTAAAKVKSALALAISTSPLAFVLDQIFTWGLENSAYIIFVLVAIAIDHVIGLYLHLFIKRDFSISRNLEGLLKKIALAVAMGILFEGINHIVKEASFVKDYLMIVLRLAVFLYPAGSAFMNTAVITRGAFPPIGLITKIKEFNKNLDLSDIKNLQNEDQ